MQDKELKPQEVKTTKKSSTHFSMVQVLLIAGFFFVIGFLFNAAGAKVQIGPNLASKDTIDLTKFWEVNDILHKKFDGDINADKQSQGAIAGMVASLGDPYTTYLTKEANQELSNQLSGKLSGIGIEVGIKNNRLSVVAPIDGTPAQKAGLRAGDIIAAIDGQDTSSITIDQAVSKIRGKAGTDVKLTIIRPGASPQEITITRADIIVPSVTSEVRDGVGIIKIRTFGDDTSTKIKTIAQELSSAGIKKIVIDVRDNPGGYLNAAVDISSQFMSSGVVVEERSRTGINKKLEALPGGLLTDTQVIVLINGGSASASEILAGALHDNNRAQLVGEKTFGKGSVQEVVCLGGVLASLQKGQCNNDSLKVTVAHWYTPKGVNISKDGIAPDVEVKFSTEDYNANRDPQLQKALELLK